MANKVVIRFRDLAAFGWRGRLIDGETYQTVLVIAEHVRCDRRPRKARTAWTMEGEHFLAALSRDRRD